MPLRGAMLIKREISANIHSITPFSVFRGITGVPRYYFIVPLKSLRFCPAVHARLPHVAVHIGNPMLLVVGNLIPYPVSVLRSRGLYPFGELIDAYPRPKIRRDIGCPIRL